MSRERGLNPAGQPEYATIQSVSPSSPRAGRDTVPCRWCDRTFESVRGRSTHERRKHAEEYHRSCIPDPKKARWNDQEVELLARAEVNLPATTRFVNQALNAVFPNRTVDAIKGARKKPEYKARVARIKTERSQSQGDGPGRCTRSNPPVAGDDNPGRDSREWLRARLAELCDRFSFIRTTNPDLYRAMESDDLGLLGVELDSLLSMTLPCKDYRPKRPRRPAQVTVCTRRKEARKRLYARVQKLYKENRSTCASSILNGTVDTVDAVTMEEKQTFWSDIFGEPSVPDHRVSDPRNGPTKHWELVSVIDNEEVIASLKSFGVTAAGTDSRKVIDLKGVDASVLALILNLLLLVEDLPHSLVEARTTLIPKGARPRTPGEFRPITVSSVVLRLLHKVLAKRVGKKGLLSLRQKAFVREHGCSSNLITLQTLIHRAKALKSPLHVALLDTRKAFDSVSTDSILYAAAEKGLPPPMIDYLRRIYSQSSSTWIGDRKVTIRRGVRQGDPISPFLFNAVLDLTLRELPEVFGYNWEGIMLTHLAFADDVVLVSSSRAGLQALIDRYAEESALSGLSVNAGKCGSLSIVIDGKKGKWVVDQVTPVRIDGQEIPTMGPKATLRYLGVAVGAFMENSSMKRKLSDFLNAISTSPLKPQQRMWILNNSVIPKLLHPLSVTPVSVGVLRSLDLLVRKALRKWLHLPTNVPTSALHASLRDGGLGVLCFETKIPRLQKARILDLAAMDDPVLERVFRSEFVATWLNNVDTMGGNVTKREEARRFADSLYQSCDGKGLKGCRNEESCASSAWINDGSRLMKSSRYVEGIKIRLNCVATEERSMRGRGPTPWCPHCSTGKSGLGHLLQSCPRFHGLRVERHDRLVKLLTTAIEEKHGNACSLLIEPRIPTPQGLKIPDVCATFPAACAVQCMDVQVVGDAGVKMPGDYNREKVQKYDVPGVDGFLRNLVPSSHPAPPRIQYGAITVSWRGILARDSMTCLRALGLSNAFAKLLVVRSIEGSVRLLATYRRTGARRLRALGEWRRRPPRAPWR